MVSKIWLSDNLRVSKTYFLEVRGVLEHPEHPSGNATGCILLVLMWCCMDSSNVTTVPSSMAKGITNLESSSIVIGL